MIINSNSIISAVTGSLITLLCVYFLKPNFLVEPASNNLTSDTTNNFVETTENSYQPNYTDEPAPTCDQDCVDQVVKNMLHSEDNSESYDDGSNLNETQILKTAEYLTTQPELISKLEQKLISHKDQAERDSIILAFARLPESQIQRIAADLASSENAIDRNDGIYLLYSAAGGSLDVESELKNIIKNDPDDSVALNAIGALQTLSIDYVGEITEQRLTKILKSGNEEAQSQALIAKVQIIEITDKTKTDIFTALNSQSEEFQTTALRVLEDVLGQQSGDIIEGDWTEDQALKAVVEKLSVDRERSPYLQVDALNILSNYYQN